MSQRLVGRSDGRTQKALRVIKKLHALGLTSPEDINRLVKVYHESRCRPRENGRDGADSGTRLRRRKWSIWAVRWMMALGFSKAEIALNAKVDYTTIAHLLDPGDCRTISLSAARRLLKAVRIVGAERLRMLLPHVAFTILDTCNQKGQVVDAATRIEVAQWARHAVSHAILSTSTPEPVVAGVDSFLAQIGNPSQFTFLIGAPRRKGDDSNARVEQLRRLEHELVHLQHRIEQERLQLTKNRPRDPLPPEGHIA